MKRVVAACVVLLNSKGEVLLAQRLPGKTMAGKWEFPGGKSLKGESLAVTVMREVKEETGLILDPRTLIPLWSALAGTKKESLCCTFFYAPLLRGQQPSPLENQPLRWVALEDLAPEEMPPPNQDLLPILKAFLREK